MPLWYVVIPKISSQTLLRVVKHILYGVAGTAGAFASSATIKRFGNNYSFFLTPGASGSSFSETALYHITFHSQYYSPLAAPFGCSSAPGTSRLQNLRKSNTTSPSKTSSRELAGVLSASLNQFTLVVNSFSQTGVLFVGIGDYLHL